MMVNSYPVGRRGMKGKHIGISTDIAIKVKEDVGHKIWGALPILAAGNVSKKRNGFHLLRIEDSPRPAAESFKISGSFSLTSSVEQVIKAKHKMSAW